MWHKMVASNIGLVFHSEKYTACSIWVHVKMICSRVVLCEISLVFQYSQIVTCHTF